MRAKKKLQRNLVRDFRRYKDQIAGILGDYSGTVEVPNRPGYVFARLANQEVKEVFNKKVPNLVDLPVWVGYADDPREPHILQVLDTRTGVERQKGEDPISQFLPLHHQTHEWFNPNGGQDVVFSDKRQFMPFRPTPIGGMLLHVYRNVGWLNGQYTYFSGSSIDLSPYVPATGAYFGLVYEDINATLAFSSGTGDFLKDGFSLTLADIPNPIPGTYPIAAVRMWGGQTGIVEAAERTDLVDLRFPFTYGFNHLYDAPHSYTGSGGLGVFVKDDETGLEFAAAGGGGGQSSSVTLFMTEDVGYVTGTFNLDTIVGGKEVLEINDINVSGTSAGSWISQEGELSFVNSGQYFIHFHAFRDGSAGCDLYDVRIGIRVNKRNSGGSHTLLGTLYQGLTGDSYVSRATETGYTLTGTFASSISFADDEGLLLEFFADPVVSPSVNCSGAGCGGVCDSPDLDIYTEGTTESGITLPVITAGSPGHIIQEEGTDLAQQNRLNFVGGGVEAVNDPANGRTTIRIPGTVSVYDDGVFQVSGTALDFMDNLDVAVTGSHVFITGQAGGGGGLSVYEDGIFRTGTSVSTLDFVENLNVSITGSTAFLSVDESKIYDSDLTPLAGITTEKSSGNPTFNFEAIPESIVKVGNFYWAVYQGGIVSDGDVRLAYATDRDGPWTEYAGNPILTHGSQGWETTPASPTMYAPFLMEKDGTFYIFYSICDKSDGTDGAVGVATSNTVTGPYTKYSGNPILSHGAGVEWDSRRVGEVGVLYHDDAWIMAYMGETSTGTFQESERVGIATAQHPFGPWTKDVGNPLLDWTVGAWDDALTADPHIWFENGYYWILYTGGSPTPWELGLAYAQKPSGPWVKHSDNPILEVGTGSSWDDTASWRGSVYEEDGLHTIVYGGLPALDLAQAKGGNARMYVEDATVASIPNSGGYSEGTSFPVSPSTNDKFYRTDRNLLYYYDGTRWLTTTLYSKEILVATDALIPFSVNGVAGRATSWFNTYDMWMEDLYLTNYIITTNNGSNYWTIDFRKFDTGVGDSSVTSRNTSADSPNTWYRNILTIDALAGTTMAGFYILITKTSSPGNLRVTAHLAYRLVG